MVEQDLRSDLDSYADKVRLKLETVDRLCHEGTLLIIEIEQGLI